MCLWVRSCFLSLCFAANGESSLKGEECGCFKVGGNSVLCLLQRFQHCIHVLKIHFSVQCTTQWQSVSALRHIVHIIIFPSYSDP